jgi:hypothetical protein
LQRLARVLGGVTLSAAILGGCAGENTGNSQVFAPAGKAPTHSRIRPDAASSSAYSTDLLSMGPLAYYPLNDTSGTVAYDSTSNSYNGTFTNGLTLGTPGLIPGDSDTAITTNGTNQDVTLPSLPITLSGINAAQPMTLVAVVEPTKTSGVIASYRGFGIGLASGYIGFYSYFFGHDLGNSVKITAGATHIVAITCSCTGANYSVRVYVDGKASVNGNPSANGSMSTTPNSYVADGATLGFYGGIVQGVGIFRSVLTSTQICQLSIDAGIPGTCSATTPTPSPTSSPTATPSPTPTPGAVTVSPTSVTVNVNNSVQVTASEPYGNMTVSPGTCVNGVAQISTPSGSGIVIQVGGYSVGTCEFSVTGSNGQEVLVPVTVPQ